MLRVKRFISKILYRWLDRLTDPQVPIQRIPMILTKKPTDAPARRQLPQVNGGNLMVWQALQTLRVKSHAKCSAIEVYAALDDVRPMSVFGVSNRLNVDSEAVGSHLSWLHGRGWIERTKFWPTTSGMRTLFHYKRKVDVNPATLGAFEDRIKNMLTRSHHA